MIKIHTLGGYNEIGRNMTAVEVDDEIIILDMGLHLEPYIKLQEHIPQKYLTKEKLLKAGVIPDDSVIEKNKVVAIIPSHAHLDHIGAVPFMEKEYNCPILCTPFAKELLKTIATDQNIKLKNKIRVLDYSKQYKTKNTIIEFVHVTHSTIQTVIVAITTKYGTILYANDFKMDLTPTLGESTDVEKLKEYAIFALICDCIRAHQVEKTQSEAIAKQMLEELFETQDFDKKAIIISTFSSHIARLQTILACAKKLNRKVLFIGRSLAKYVEAANAADPSSALFQDITIVKYKNQIKKELKEIKDKKEEYLIVATGHQGEPNSILTELAADKLALHLEPQDVVIFSSTVIPNEENRKNRQLLEEQLQKKHVTIYKDIHVSGHASREDLRDFLKITKPKHLIPAHAPKEMQKNLLAIAKELGYSDEFLHLSQNGQIHIL